MLRPGEDVFDTFEHLRRRASRERQQQDARRVRPLADEVGDAVGEGVGLSGAGASDDEQRRWTERRGGPLLLVEGLHPGRIHAAAAPPYA